MRWFVVVLLSVLSTTASAVDKDKLKHAISICWLAPLNQETRHMKATLEVHLSPAGEIEDLKVTESPSGPQSKAFVDSTIRAVRRCAPYSNVPAGKVTINFKAPTG
ncbi:hypothetical protein AAIB41_04255 [Brucella sp. BE17]|uniref:energy transducer TonB n=1 Tax=Brucella sp. BE17 TaxID=3142977 RepID=UPI0031BA95BE